MLKSIPVFSRYLLLILIMGETGISAVAQINSPHKQGKLVPYKSGFIVFDRVDTSLIPTDTFYPPLVKIVPQWARRS